MRNSLIHTKSMKSTESSSWKFVNLEFETQNGQEKIVIEINKVSSGTAYLDNVGVIPKF